MQPFFIIKQKGSMSSNKYNNRPRYADGKKYSLQAANC